MPLRLGTPQARYQKPPPTQKRADDRLKPDSWPAPDTAISELKLRHVGLGSGGIEREDGADFASRPGHMKILASLLHRPRLHLLGNRLTLRVETPRTYISASAATNAFSLLA